jgi:hypothetical protein
LDLSKDRTLKKKKKKKKKRLKYLGECVVGPRLRVCLRALKT